MILLSEKKMEVNSMSKFELDTQALNTEQSQKSTRIKSKSLCTPGCNPTATLCTSCIFACA